MLYFFSVHSIFIIECIIPLRTYSRNCHIRKKVNFCHSSRDSFILFIYNNWWDKLYLMNYILHICCDILAKRYISDIIKQGCFVFTEYFWSHDIVFLNKIKNMKIKQNEYILIWEYSQFILESIFDIENCHLTNK